MDLGVALFADAEALEAVEPGEGALDDPAVAPQVRARLDPAASDAGRDVPQAKTHADEGEVVCLVGVRFGRSTARSAAWSLHRRDRVDERKSLDRVVDVRRS